MTSRRTFLRQGAVGAAGAWLAHRGAYGGIAPAVLTSPRAAPALLDLRRPPDSIAAQTSGGEVSLRAVTAGRWEASGISVTVVEASGAQRVQLSAPSVDVRRIHLRWRGDMNGARLLLGDAWERGYGDLEWRGFVPDRVMPWYVAAFDGDATAAYGVRTGARAFCWWQVDPRGISLWTDVRSGGVGVRLGERVLDVCDVVHRPGAVGESAFASLHAFCRDMCPRPRLPAQPVYGSNDWYWAYGQNSAQSVMRDTHSLLALSPPGDNRPFVVIDDGWQPSRRGDRGAVGLWDRGNADFPDMPGLAGQVRAAGARPGIWIRPLLAPVDAPDGWRLSRSSTVLDPTAPDVRRKVADDIARLRQWGFELIKHDYSTYDIFGRWGFDMGASLTKDGWSFAEGPGRTTAEVLDELYGTIREAAGDTAIIGCNTVSHLSAGRFEMCRIGDDTSGRDWARTRRMGVNSLAFRGVQHGTFYVADPDCVGVTTDIPWEMNRQWLDLLARSGTMLFVSLAPDALGDAQKRDLRAAFALAAHPQPLAEPLDWQHNSLPAHWRAGNAERDYDWTGADGASPP